MEKFDLARSKIQNQWKTAAIGFSKLFDILRKTLTRGKGSQNSSASVSFGQLYYEDTHHIIYFSNFVIDLPQDPLKF